MCLEARARPGTVLAGRLMNWRNAASSEIRTMDQPVRQASDNRARADGHNLNCYPPRGSIALSSFPGIGSLSRVWYFRALLRTPTGSLPLLMSVAMRSHLLVSYVMSHRAHVVSSLVDGPPEHLEIRHVHFLTFITHVSVR